MANDALIQTPAEAPVFAQYDPRKVIVSWAGVNFSGFADGTFIEVERMHPMWEDYVGTTGAVARCRTRDDRGKITITLLAHHPMNDILHALVVADGNDWQRSRAIQISDANNEMRAKALHCWIAGTPKYTRGKTSDVVTWEFRVDLLYLYTNKDIEV